MTKTIAGLLAVILLVFIPGCAPVSPGNDATTATIAEAKTFIDDVNKTLLRLSIESSQADWVANTYITDDTQAITARASQVYIDTAARYAKEAVRFDKVDVPPDLRR